MRKALSIVFVVGLMLGVSSQLFAAEKAEEKTDDTKSNLSKVVDDVKEMGEAEARSVAERVIEDLGDAAVKVFDAVEEKGGHLIDKVTPVLNTLVKETGRLYFVKALGCIFLACALAAPCIVALGYLYSDKCKFKDPQKDFPICSLTKVVISIALFLIILINGILAVGNMAKAVSPTRTLLIEVLEASRGDSFNN